MSAGLSIYLIERRASDLVFYVENDPHVALTVGEPPAEPSGGKQESILIFGTARILTPLELHETPAEIQTAHSLRNQQAPGVYVPVELHPTRVHYSITRDDGTVHQHTIDADRSRAQ
jgi:hypothetical protein